MRLKEINCVECGGVIKDGQISAKDCVSLNRKIISSNPTENYCVECICEMCDCDVQILIDKINDFKQEGCTLFS